MAMLLLMLSLEILLRKQNGWGNGRSTSDMHECDVSTHHLFRQSKLVHCLNFYVLSQGPLGFECGVLIWVRARKGLDLGSRVNRFGFGIWIWVRAWIDLDLGSRENGFECADESMYWHVYTSHANECLHEYEEKIIVYGENIWQYFDNLGNTHAFLYLFPVEVEPRPRGITWRRKPSLSGLHVAP